MEMGDLPPSVATNHQAYSQKKGHCAINYVN